MNRFAVALCVIVCVIVCAARTGAQPAAAAPDLTLTLRDHNFKLTAPVPSGHSIWLVKNAGTERHQALVVKLPPGVNEWAERGWINNGSRGPRPGQKVSSVELEPGAEAHMPLDLGPGNYLLLCTMEEPEGRHFDLGMIYKFTIE